MKLARYTRRIVIGDIHGELDAFKDILQDANMIDVKGNWIGGDSILIQTGDVIDRGPHSLESVALLRKLQKEAPEANGEVVRICGNHELMALQHDWRYIDFPNPAAYVRELKNEIAHGKVLASYTDGERLYSHAGLRSAIKDALIQEIIASNPKNPRIDKTQIDLFILSDYINTTFRECVSANELHRHPIFQIDPRRGGNDPVGGIFWCDYASLDSSLNAWTTPQVFGHTPTNEKAVKTSHELKLINIDAGMCRVYGGNRVYLEITSDGQLIQHNKTKSEWTAMKLSFRSPRRE